MASVEETRKRLRWKVSSRMTSLTVELPDKLAQDLNAIVEAGSFSDEGEVVRQALREFLSRHRLELIERFQREDIAWALQQSKAER